MPNYPPTNPFQDQLLQRQKRSAFMPGMGGGAPRSTTQPVPGSPPIPLDTAPPAPSDGRPPGFTGDWPPKLPTGAHYGDRPGQIVYDTPGDMPGGRVPGQATPPPAGSPPGTPGTGGTYSPGGPGGVPATNQPPVDNTKYGGGWNEPHGQDPVALALKQAFAKGLTGQAAVDWVNSNTSYTGAIAFYADKNTYGAPNWYAAPSPSGALDLIKRTPETGPTGGTPAQPIVFTPGTSYKPTDVTGLRQYAPSGAWGNQPMYTDDKGHFFIPDPANAGQGIYVGQNPSDANRFTKPQPGTNGPDMRSKPIPNPNTPPTSGGPRLGLLEESQSIRGSITPPIDTSTAPPVSYGALPASTTPAPDVPPPPAPREAAGYVPPTTAPSPIAPTTAPALGGAPTTGVSRLTTGGTPLQGQTGSFFDALMKRANQTVAPNANDPVIKNQVDAYRAQQVRGERDTLTQLAEQGGPSANLETQRRMLGETAGQNTSAFEAGLMQNELATRRQEIQQALSGAQGLLTSEQQIQLQEELASLSNAERQFEFVQGQGQQAEQFGAGLKQRGHEFDTSTAVQQGQFSSQQKEQARQFDAQYGQGAWEFMTALKNSQYQAEQQRALSQSQFGYGSRQQESQFGRQQDQRKAEFAATLGLDYANLSQQDRQFMDNLMQRAFEFDTNDQFRKSPLAR